MNRVLKHIALSSILVLLAACQTSPEGIEDLAGGQETLLPQATAGLSREDRFPATGMLSQWAVAAEASSVFSEPEWSADKALGGPDSPGCGDYQFAWASAASDSIDTLVLEYQTLVYPLEIIVYQSYKPDQVVKVEVLDPESGGYYTVLQKNPLRVDRPCPFELIITVQDINFATDTIRLTLDQSQLGLGWNEIDAVQLIGSVNPPPD